MHAKTLGPIHGIALVSGLALIASVPANQALADGCQDYYDVNAGDVRNGPMTCSCDTLFLGVFNVGTHSVDCQRSIDTYPAHGHCGGPSDLIDCQQFGTVTVTRQNYKCKFEINGPSVSVGDVEIGLGTCLASCETQGPSIQNGSHSTSVALNCNK